MKATINGIEIEGTPTEIDELLELRTGEYAELKEAMKHTTIMAHIGSKVVEQVQSPSAQNEKNNEQKSALSTNNTPAQNEKVKRCRGRPKKNKAVSKNNDCNKTKPTTKHTAQDVVNFLQQNFPSEYCAEYLMRKFNFKYSTWHHNTIPKILSIDGIKRRYDNKKVYLKAQYKQQGEQQKKW